MPSRPRPRRSPRAQHDDTAHGPVAHRSGRWRLGGARWRLGGARWWLAGAGLLVAAALTACTRDEPASVTVPRPATTTTTTPEAPAPVEPERSTLPPVQWVLQVGGPGDDVLHAVANRGDVLSAVGATAGLEPLPAPPVAGGSAALVITASTGGELTAAETITSEGADAATTITTNGTTRLLCGTTTGDIAAASGGGVDTFCSTVDEEGQLGTPRQLGGAEDENLTGVDIAEDHTDGYASGTVSGMLPGAQDPSYGSLGGGDALVLMISEDGTPVWARQFGTAAADAALGVVATPTGDGVVAGYTDGALEGPSSGGRDAWVSRFDPQGHQRWVTQIGSAGDDELRGVTTVGEARRGNELFIAAGSTTGDIDAEGILEHHGGADALVAAFSSNGTLEWLNQFGGEGDEYVNDIVADGNTVYLVGTTSGGYGELLENGGEGGGVDGFITAVDVAAGVELWTGRFGTPADEMVLGATTTDDGLLVVSGATAGQLADTPPAGGLDGFLLAIPLMSSGGGAASMV